MGEGCRVADKAFCAISGYEFAGLVDRVERSLLAAAREHHDSAQVCSGDVAHNPQGKRVGQ